MLFPAAFDAIALDVIRVDMCTDGASDVEASDEDVDASELSESLSESESDVLESVSEVDDALLDSEFLCPCVRDCRGTATFGMETACGASACFSRFLGPLSSGEMLSVCQTWIMHCLPSSTVFRLGHEPLFRFILHVQSFCESLGGSSRDSTTTQYSRNKIAVSQDIH